MVVEMSVKGDWRGRGRDLSCTSSLLCLTLRSFLLAPRNVVKLVQCDVFILHSDLALRTIIQTKFLISSQKEIVLDIMDR